MHVMKIALIQADISWEDVNTNLSSAQKIMDRVTDVDLYIFPEMFTTGCTIEPEHVAQPMSGTAVNWLIEQSHRRQAAIVGSMPIVEDGRYFNRMFFVKPDRTLTWYDKRHLFTYGNEHLKYTAGKERHVVEYKGIRFLLQICYDLRFPVWSRNRCDYDAAIYIAAWPEGRISVWDTLTQARAIENQCYVFAVNRIGADQWGRYNGHTTVVDFYGNRLATCEDDVCGVLTYDLTLDKLRKFREKFPVLNDADSFTVS